jgi:hypothetical protein
MRIVQASKACGPSRGWRGDQPGPPSRPPARRSREIGHLPQTGAATDQCTAWCGEAWHGKATRGATSRSWRSACTERRAVSARRAVRGAACDACAWRRAPPIEPAMRPAGRSTRREAKRARDARQPRASRRAKRAARAHASGSAAGVASARRGGAARPAKRAVVGVSGVAWRGVAWRGVG